MLEKKFLFRSFIMNNQNHGNETNPYLSGEFHTSFKNKLF